MARPVLQHSSSFCSETSFITECLDPTDQLSPHKVAPSSEPDLKEAIHDQSDEDIDVDDVDELGFSYSQEVFHRSTSPKLSAPGSAKTSPLPHQSKIHDQFDPASPIPSDNHIPTSSSSNINASNQNDQHAWNHRASTLLSRVMKNRFAVPFLRRPPTSQSESSMGKPSNRSSSPISCSTLFDVQSHFMSRTFKTPYDFLDALASVITPSISIDTNSDSSSSSAATSATNLKSKTKVDPKIELHQKAVNLVSFIASECDSLQLPTSYFRSSIDLHLTTASMPSSSALASASSTSLGEFAFDAVNTSASISAAASSSKITPSQADSTFAQPQTRQRSTRNNPTISSRRRDAPLPSLTTATTSSTSNPPCPSVSNLQINPSNGTSTLQSDGSLSPTFPSTKRAATPLVDNFDFPDSKSFRPITNQMNSSSKTILTQPPTHPILIPTSSLLTSKSSLTEIVDATPLSEEVSDSSKAFAGSSSTPLNSLEQRTESSTSFSRAATIIREDSISTHQLEQSSKSSSTTQIDPETSFSSSSSCFVAGTPDDENEFQSATASSSSDLRVLCLHSPSKFANNQLADSASSASSSTAANMKIEQSPLKTKLTASRQSQRQKAQQQLQQTLAQSQSDQQLPHNEVDSKYQSHQHRTPVKKQPATSSASFTPSESLPLNAVLMKSPLQSVPEEDQVENPSRSSPLLSSSSTNSSRAPAAKVSKKRSAQKLSQPSNNEANIIPDLSPFLYSSDMKAFPFYSASTSSSSSSANAHPQLSSHDSTTSTVFCKELCGTLVNSTKPAATLSYTLASPSNSLQFESAAATFCGSVKESNQDRFFLQRFPTLSSVQQSHSSPNELKSNGIMFGVFDGHGVLGDSAAQICADTFPIRLIEKLSHTPTSTSSELSEFSSSSSSALFNLQPYSRSKSLISHFTRSLHSAFTETHKLLLSVAAHEQHLMSRLVSRFNIPNRLLMDYGTTAVVGCLVPIEDNHEHSSIYHPNSQFGASPFPTNSSSSSSSSSSSISIFNHPPPAQHSHHINQPQGKSRNQVALIVAHTGDSRCMIFERMHFCPAFEFSKCTCLHAVSSTSSAATDHSNDIDSSRISGSNIIEESESQLSESASMSSSQFESGPLAKRPKSRRIAAASASAGLKSTAKNASNQTKGVVWTWRSLTPEHDPTNLSNHEKERVEQQGGLCFDTGRELRVYPANLKFEDARTANVTLNMSRALGHLKLSQHGVIAEPSVAALCFDHRARAPMVALQTASDEMSQSESNHSTDALSSSSASGGFKSNKGKTSSGRGRGGRGGRIGSRSASTSSNSATSDRESNSDSLWFETVDGKPSDMKSKSPEWKSAAVVLDRFVVAGSDGLWDVITPEQVAQELQRTQPGKLLEATQALIRQADQAWLGHHADSGHNQLVGDNITVSIIRVFSEDAGSSDA